MFPDTFVFSTGGMPADTTLLNSLWSHMQSTGISNSFDPGPTARADHVTYIQNLKSKGVTPIVYPNHNAFQVQHGPGALVAVVDDELTPGFVHFGEWGSYFHDLSSDDAFWQTALGTDYDAYKQYIKPVGSKGYNYAVTTKRECYDLVKDYFINRAVAYGNKVLSVTGHSHYEAYAGEWGADIIGIELGIPAFSQSKLAFSRGASKQWNKPFAVQISPWLGGFRTTAGAGVDNGHSASYYKRAFLHAWMSGAMMVTAEGSYTIWYEDTSWAGNAHKTNAQSVADIMFTKDRGTPFNPVAIVIDHLTGYSPYWTGKTWGKLTETTSDLELYNLLEKQIFPDAYNIRTGATAGNPEDRFFVPTPHAEMFDVYLSNFKPEVLSQYSSVLLFSDITFNEHLINNLKEIVTAGVKLVIQPRHQSALGASYSEIDALGDVEVLGAITTDENGVTPVGISVARLGQFVSDYMPFTVDGNVQWRVNAISGGYLVELINNRGVTKTGNTAAIIDNGEDIFVTVTPAFTPSSITEWMTGGTSLTLNVPSGEVRIIEVLI